MAIQGFAVFEYVYRDAGNFKAWGKLLLAGSPKSADVAKIRRALEFGNGFIAEQVAVPPLYEQLWSECGSGYDPEMDHAWHEFIDLRPATVEECAQLAVHRSLTGQVEAFGNVTCWREELSHNWR